MHAGTILELAGNLGPPGRVAELWEGVLLVRKIGLVLLGLGAFLLVLALMVRFYAYPQLAVAPVNPDSVSTLVGEDATIFDRETLTEVTTDLTAEVITVGDAEAATDDVVVWVSKNSTRSSDGVIRSRSAERVAFDAVTGEAVNCCEAYEEVSEGERVAVNREGLVFKFPFNTQKKDYDFWDDTVGEAVPATYEGTEDIEGVETYKFVQVIDRTQTGSIDLPADLLGESGDETLTGDMVYSNTRTFWVEPNTGAIINRTEEINNSIAYDGSDRITTTGATMKFTDDYIKSNADEYGPSGTMLGLARGVVPIALGVLGVLLLLAGLLLGRRRSSEA